MSDIPGAGRTLGKLYSRWGYALETSLGNFAHRRGFGPDAVAERVRREMDGRWLFSYDGVFLFDARYQRVEKDCKKLVEYAKSGTPLTKIRAALRIIELASAFPPVGHYLSQYNVLALLETLQDECLDENYVIDSYGSMLRNARLCLEENQATASAWNMLGVQLFQEYELGGNNYTRTVARFNEGLYGLIDACQNPLLSDIALNYLNSVLKHVDLTWDCPHITENVLQYLALHQVSFWTKLFGILIDLIGGLQTELDQGHLSILDQVITATLSWFRDSPARNIHDMFKLLYSPKWRSLKEAEHYKEFIRSLLRLLSSIGGSELRKLLPLAVHDAGIYRHEIRGEIDWYILYGLLGNDEYVRWKEFASERSASA